MMIFRPGELWQDRVGNVWEIVEVYDGGPFPVTATSQGRKSLFTSDGRYQEIGESRLDLVRKIDRSQENEIAQELESIAEMLLCTAKKLRTKTF